MNEPCFRVGLIGYGRSGRNIHARTIPFGYDDELIDRMMTAIENGNEQDANALFRHFSENNTAFESFLYERVVYYNILYRLSALANKHSKAINPVMVNSVIHAADSAELTARFNAIIRILCEAFGDDRYNDLDFTSEAKNREGECKHACANRKT